MIFIQAILPTAGIFLLQQVTDDPYNEQFKKTLAVIEKDEANGWEPEVLAKKIVKIVECKNPHQRYIIASFEQKLAVVIKVYFTREIIQDDPSGSLQN